MNDNLNYPFYVSCGKRLSQARVLFKRRQLSTSNDFEVHCLPVFHQSCSTLMISGGGITKTMLFREVIKSNDARHSIGRDGLNKTGIHLKENRNDCNYQTR